MVYFLSIFLYTKPNFFIFFFSIKILNTTTKKIVGNSHHVKRDRGIIIHCVLRIRIILPLPLLAADEMDGCAMKSGQVVWGRTELDGRLELHLLLILFIVEHISTKWQFLLMPCIFFLLWPPTFSWTYWTCFPISRASLPQLPPISQHHPSLPLPTPTFLPPAGPLLTWFGLSSYGHLLFHVHVPLRHTSPQLSQDARKPGLAVVAFHGLLGESLQRPLGWHTLWSFMAYWG